MSVLQTARLTATLLASMSAGCSAEAERSNSQVVRVTVPYAPARAETEPTQHPVEEQAQPPAIPVVPVKHDAEPIVVDMTRVDPEDESSRAANLGLAHSAQFESYLTDGSGQALYMLVDDVAGASTSACLGDCARDWPPFDIEVVHTPSSIDALEVSRFHREDGAWQTTYKGHGLYYRAAEAGTRDITGDGVNQRWFVARDYLAFLSAARTFTPAGGMAPDARFLTDGFGRTLYVCLDDQPGTDSTQTVSSCDSACIVTRPVFDAAQTDRTTLLPSPINPSELNTFVRLDGRMQLTYRGWPLYYDSGDVVAGSTDAHNDGSWRAIDPVAFGLATTRGLPD